MKRSGSADLPFHYGYVPTWLAESMAKLGLAITEVILMEYGKADWLRSIVVPVPARRVGVANLRVWFIIEQLTPGSSLMPS